MRIHRFYPWKKDNARTTDNGLNYWFFTWSTIIFRVDFDLISFCVTFKSFDPKTSKNTKNTIHHHILLFWKDHKLKICARKYARFLSVTDISEIDFTCSTFFFHIKWCPPLLFPILMRENTATHKLTMNLLFNDSKHRLYFSSVFCTVWFITS